MKKNTIIMGIFAFSIFFALIYIGYSIKESESNYHALESDLIEAAYVYYKNEKINITNKDSIRIDADTLVEKGLVETLKVDEDECRGYVIIKKENNEFDYKAYIKCNNYENLEEK